LVSTPISPKLALPLWLAPSLADFANWFTFTALGTDLLLLESRILNILDF
tara:strand:+ start:116 stop:265 length:150 start_codon:yes stop_codon:yes gene_type:complete